MRAGAVAALAAALPALTGLDAPSPARAPPPPALRGTRLRGLPLPLGMLGALRLLALPHLGRLPLTAEHCLAQPLLEVGQQGSAFFLYVTYIHLL